MGKEIMRKSLLRKELALGIIMLFILLGSVSNITGKTEKNINTNITIILSKNIQTKPLGNFAQRFLQAKINITIYDNCTFYYQEQKGDGFYNVTYTIRVIFRTNTSM